ncbi:hypothetical protein Dimus_005158 [Dionaea muscipula]
MHDDFGFYPLPSLAGQQVEDSPTVSNLCWFVMLRGSLEFYSYGIYAQRLIMVLLIRIAFKLSKNWQREMPLPDDQLSGRCQVLPYSEAVQLTNPVEPEFKGQVLINQLKEVAPSIQKSTAELRRSELFFHQSSSFE